MAADPELVASEGGLLQLIAELRREVDELKDLNRLWGSAPEGQSIHVYTAAGVLLGTLGGGVSATAGGLIVRSQVPGAGGGAPNAIVQVGRATATGYSGQDGVQVGPTSTIPHMLWTATEGVVLPSEHVGWNRWADAVDTMGVTSGTFVGTWLAKPLASPSLHVKTSLTIDCPAGTTGTVRLNLVGTAVTAESTFSANGLKTVAWTPGVSLGSEHSFLVEVARLTGTGTILVHRPYDLVFGNWKSVSGTAGNGGGVWS